MYALSAAVLVQTVSRACSQGVSQRCGCSQMPNEAPGIDFQWGGCGDDVNFAVEFSRSFADARWLKRKKTSELSLVNVHNSEAGRKVCMSKVYSNFSFFLIKILILITYNYCLSSRYNKQSPM